MTNYKLKSHRGNDPQDGKDTCLVGLYSLDTDELVACLAFFANADGIALANDLETFKVGNAVGVYRLGDPMPIAHEFLADPTTVLIAELEVSAERVNYH